MQIKEIRKQGKSSKNIDDEKEAKGKFPDVVGKPYFRIGKNGLECCVIVLPLPMKNKTSATFLTLDNEVHFTVLA